MSNGFNNWKSYISTPKQSFLTWEGERTNESLKWLVPGSSLVVAGHTNHGKTSLIMSMIVGLLNNNQELMVIDFSVDDPEIKRRSQYAAILGGLPINSVMNYKKALHTDKDIQAFSVALNTLKAWDEAERLLIYESLKKDGDTFIDQNKASFIVKTVNEFREKYPERKIVFVIDAVNDVEYDLGRVFGELDQEKALCMEMQKLAVGTQSVMLANVHIRKNMLKRPTLEDIKGNSYTAYRATVALGVFNDAKAVGIHKTNILWEEAGNDGHLRSYPILEAWFIKSKVDDCKYPVVAFQQWPHKGKVREVEPTRQDQFVNLIYGEA